MDEVCEAIEGMRFAFWVAYLVSIGTVCLAVEEKVDAFVTLLQPEESEVLEISEAQQAGAAGATLTVEYTVDFSSSAHGYEDKRRVDSCFEVLAIDGTHLPSPLRCYPFLKSESRAERTFVVNNLLAGKYTLNLFTRERGSEQLRLEVSRSFTVGAMVLPSISMSNTTRVAIGLNAQSGSVYIPYKVLHPQRADSKKIPNEELMICVEIELASTGSEEEKRLMTVLDYPEVSLGEESHLKFCLPKVENGLVLNNVMPSVPLYKLSVHLRDKNGNNEGEITTSYLRINRLEHVLPKIAVAPAQRTLEWKLPAAKTGQSEADRTASGAIQYRVRGLASAVEQIMVCTELLLLQGGYTEFDLYATYHSGEGSDVERAIDEGIQKIVESERAAQAAKLRRLQNKESPVSEDGEQREQGQEQEEYPLLFNQCDRPEAGKNEVSLYLEGLPAGAYLAKVHVAYNASRDDAANRSIIHFANRVENVVVMVQPEREFVPTYEWRELRGWHSVPLGVESRLPVAALEYEELSEEDRAAMGMTDSGADRLTWDDSEDIDSFDHKIDYDRSSVGFKTEPEEPEYTKTPAFYAKPGTRKTARIPSPWQIQLPMPPPCKFFLRSNVYEDMTTSDILRVATKQCRDLPEHCMDLVEDQDDGSAAVVIDRDANVREADLFNRKLRLELLNEAEECVPAA